jgi:Outer membrane lipoprotein carrier protein LolA-like
LSTTAERSRSIGSIFTTSGNSMLRGCVPAWFCARLCLGLAVSLSCVPAQAASPPDAIWGLPQLMHELAQVRSASARFTERKTLKVLKAPLVIIGTLEYQAPDHLQKVILSPYQERFRVDGNQIIIVAGPGHRTHTLSLSDEPQVAGLVEGIRATLSGDLPILEQLYEVRLGGNDTQWELDLQPKSGELAHFVTSIRIRGHQNWIDFIATDSPNGDRSEMSIIEDTVSGH